MKAHTVFFCFTLLLLLLGSTLPPTAQAQSYTQEEIVDYFLEIALGSEFKNKDRRIKKWQKDIRYHIIGNPHTEYLAELERVMDELHKLTGLSFTEVRKTRQANLVIVFGSANNYIEIEPQAKKYTDKNWGLFFTRWNGLGEIYYATMYVDIFRAKGKQVKHLLREELTQLLGLMRDSYKYKESIFYQRWTTGTEYAPIDRALLRLLYHPDMPMNANKEVAREAAVQIIRQMGVDKLLAE